MTRGLLLRELAARIDRAVDRGAGSRARDLLALSDAELGRAMGVEREPDPEPAAVAELDQLLAAQGCEAVCAHDPDWPEAFARLGPAAPRALFVRGRRELLEAVGTIPVVTIVG
ncbi:MAG TPA: hypothetical protein VKA36_00845, partial [Solirubrobacterales bacterium]|nr:hypothetical protein [Solirubrobacterales bacterium]